MTSLKFMVAGMAAGVLVLAILAGAFIAGREFADDEGDGRSASGDSSKEETVA